MTNTRWINAPRAFIVDQFDGRLSPHEPGEIIYVRPGGRVDIVVLPPPIQRPEAVW